MNIYVTKEFLSKGKNFSQINVGAYTKIEFCRTVRIPDDGKIYNLPSWMGSFPIYRASDYSNTVPQEWLKEASFFIPMYQKEAMFIKFTGTDWHPTAAKIYAGKINAITGDQYNERISATNQDYIVMPHQRWLDGFYSGDSIVRQFVAMPLGMGYTVEAQMTDEEIEGGIELLVCDAKDGRFPKINPEIRSILIKIDKCKQLGFPKGFLLTESERVIFFRYTGEWLDIPSDTEHKDIHFQPAVDALGLAAGGSIKQQIFEDIYGAHTWDESSFTKVKIHIVNIKTFVSITGEQAPESPITIEDYSSLGIPWYNYQDEAIKSIWGKSKLSKVLSVFQINNSRGIKTRDEYSPNFTENLVNIHVPMPTESLSLLRNSAQDHASLGKWNEALSDITSVIEIGIETSCNDYAFRSQCNYHIGQFIEGETDASLGLQIDENNRDLRMWRAYCRMATENHNGVIEDTESLINDKRTALIGCVIRASSALKNSNYQQAMDTIDILERLGIKDREAEEIKKYCESKYIVD
jgi:hypothetical protein